MKEYSTTRSETMEAATQIKPCTAKDIEAKFSKLNHFEMIRIADKEPIYIGYHADLMCIKLWDCTGFEQFGARDIEGDILYFEVTKNYTKIVLLDEFYDDQFCKLASILRAACVVCGEKDTNARLFKHAFDTYIFK